MASSSFLLFIILTASALMASSSSVHKTFCVGGNDGWSLKPSESYNHWAERMRFLINDTLVFKYKKGDDSVMLVKEEDYGSCYLKKPLKRMASGTSVFRFDRSGPFFFVSGKKHRCSLGQKMIIVVLSAAHSSVGGDSPQHSPFVLPPFSAPSQPPSYGVPPSSASSQHEGRSSGEDDGHNQAAKAPTSSAANYGGGFRRIIVGLSVVCFSFLVVKLS